MFGGSDAGPSAGLLRSMNGPMSTAGAPSFAPPTNEPELVTLGTRIDNLGTRAAVIAQMLEGTAERVLGPTPQVAEKSPSVSHGPGMLGRLYELVHNVDRILDHAEAQARRLSQL